MTEPRIISFLPAATEMVYALGLGHQLVGVSHECDFPAQAKKKPVVVRPALPLESMSLRQIDTAVAERIGSGQSLYQVDEALLRELKPNLILTQNLCQVCGPAGNEVSVVLKTLSPKPEIVWMTPHSLEDIFQNIRELGDVTHRVVEAKKLIESLGERLLRIQGKTSSNDRSMLDGPSGKGGRPRVFCLEWTDPYYCCGHWVPEMIALAGGHDALGRFGVDSVRIPWEDIAAWTPEILIVAPCGFDTEKAAAQAQSLLRQPGWADLPAVRNNRVFAVNANAYFARPGPRVVDGVELLAHLIDPERFDWHGPADAFRRVDIAPSKARAEIQLDRVLAPRGVLRKSCSRCGAEFSCGPGSGKNGQCWCNEFPTLPSVDQDADCFCPHCLRAEVEKQKAH